MKVSLLPSKDTIFLIYQKYPEVYKGYYYTKRIVFISNIVINVVENLDHFSITLFKYHCAPIDYNRL